MAIIRWEDKSYIAFSHINDSARKIAAGAKLTWEYIVDVGAYSSSIPGNNARKIA
jgi:hypothetical protein